MQKKITLRYLIIISLFLALAKTNYVCATNKTSGWKFEEYKGLATPDDIPIFDEFNEKHYLEEYEGRTILLVFWATWCSSCLQEMADLDTLQKDFRKLPFVVLPVSEDYQGAKAIDVFYKANNIRHMPRLYDYKNALFNAFSVVGMPTSFLLTENGMNIAVFKGAVNWHDEEVRAILLSHIPGNPSEPKNSYKERSLNQVIQKPTKEEAPQTEIEVKPESGGAQSASDKTKEHELNKKSAIKGEVTHDDKNKK